MAKQNPGIQGIALLIVLAIIVMSSAMIAVIVFFVMRGTEYTALQKKYSTSKEASIGAIDVLTKEIIPMAISGQTLSSVLTTFNVITTAKVERGYADEATANSCFADKLTKATGLWGGACDNKIEPKTNPDLKFTLSGTGAQPYDVYVKIIDTSAGNTNISGIVLEGMGTAESAGGVITTQHFPYLYTIEVQGEKQQSPSERANLEVLYAY